MGKSFVKYFLISSFLDLIFSQMTSERRFSRSLLLLTGSSSLSQQAVAIINNPWGSPQTMILRSLLSFWVIIMSFSLSSSVKESIFFPNLFSRYSMNFVLKISFLDLIFSQMISERDFSRSFRMLIGFSSLSQKVLAVANNPWDSPQTVILSSLLSFWDIIMSFSLSSSVKV